MNLRQSILIRTDLNLPVGLLCAQVAHIHLELVRRNVNDLGEIKFDEKIMKIDDWVDWSKSPYLFIHQVPNKEALEYFINEARLKELEVNTWEDTIYLNLSPTQQRAFENVLIGCSIGPHDSDAIKAVIGDLPLL